jgi:DNA-binding response OmpR family regulator
LSNVKPIIFIVDVKDNITSFLAGTFWLKGFKPFKFTNGKECLTKFEELNGKVDAVIIIGNQTALDDGIMLIVNVKKMNPNTKILVISEKQDEKYKIPFEEYGADDIVLVPLSPTDISDRILLMISKHKWLEKQKDLI